MKDNLSSSEFVGSKNCALHFSEIKHGIAVQDEHGNEVGRSRLAALKAVTQVAVSRNVIVIPSMGERSFHPLLYIVSVSRTLKWGL